MATTWKKVLTEQDVAPDQGQSVADNQTGLVTGNAVFDYIQAQNYGTGGGDIELVAQGHGIETSSTSAFTTIADVTSGDAYIRVKAGSGITVDANGVSVDFTNMPGDGLVESNGVIDVVGGDGITATPNEIEVTVDNTSISLSAADGTGAVQVKDGGVTFSKLSSSSYVASGSQVGSSDTQLLTAGAIAESYPNVTLSAAQGQTYNYLTLSGTQGIVMNQVSIGDDTDLSVSSGNTVQGQLNLALQGSNIGGSAYGLGTTDNVEFANITGTGALTVNGNTTLGNSVTDTVTISGNATIAGDLTVEGSTVTLEVATLTVEDKNITLASGATTPAAGSTGGISVATSTTTAYHPNVQWKSTEQLTGWALENHNASRTTQGDDLVPIAVMKVSNAAPTSELAAGAGSLWYDTTGDNLYIRTE